MVKIALFQPDIPQNTGAILRLAACMGVKVDIIGPCGFVLDDKRLKRAGMDYIDQAVMTVHTSWDSYRTVTTDGRLVLLTTGGDIPYSNFTFAPDDTLLLGRESAGVPDDVHHAADARLVIPIAEGARSLNVALAASMVLGEAIRQTDPGTQKEETR